MFSRRKVVQMQALDLNEVLRNLQAMLPRLLGETIELEFHGRPDLPLIEGDLGMMEQVVINLSTNARDAMPRGGQLTISLDVVEVDTQTVQANPEAREGRFVSLVVSDNGCGMDEATRKHVFEPFFTTKAVGKGTGLGLATIHGIVTEHKGWIEVSSTVGAGSIFRVFLPAGATSTPPTIASSPDSKLRLGRETILLVEDEASLREMLSLCLRRQGYEVLEAGNGVEALELWQQNAPKIDLLFADMVMPEGISGRELAERFRKEKSRLKIIISSGYSDETWQDGAPTGQGMIFLPKPFQLATLAEAVRECLDDA
jgi:CheY-like chemotaxis protein